MANIVSDHFGVPLEVEGHSGQHNLIHDLPGLNTCPPPRAAVTCSPLPTTLHLGLTVFLGCLVWNVGCCLSSCPCGILMIVLVPVGEL